MLHNNLTNWNKISCGAFRKYIRTRTHVAQYNKKIFDLKDNFTFIEFCENSLTCNFCTYSYANATKLSFTCVFFSLFALVEN